MAVAAISTERFEHLAAQRLVPDIGLVSKALPLTAGWFISVFGIRAFISEVQ